MEVSKVLRLLVGPLVGAGLGAVLSIVQHPLSFVSDVVGAGGGASALLLAMLIILAHAAAFGIGFLAAKIAGTFEILVAVISVWFGAALAQSVTVSNLPFDLYAVYYAGFYPVFAAIGGTVVYAGRQRREASE